MALNRLQRRLAMGALALTPTTVRSLAELETRADEDYVPGISPTGRDEFFSRLPQFTKSFEIQ
jgi:hypothetical protein